MTSCARGLSWTLFRLFLSSVTLMLFRPVRPLQNILDKSNPLMDGHALRLLLLNRRHPAPCVWCLCWSLRSSYVHLLLSVSVSSIDAPCYSWLVWAFTPSKPISLWSGSNLTRTRYIVTSLHVRVWSTTISIHHTTYLCLWMAIGYIVIRSKSRENRIHLFHRQPGCNPIRPCVLTWLACILYLFYLYSLCVLLITITPHYLSLFDHVDK